MRSYIQRMTVQAHEPKIFYGGDNYTGVSFLTPTHNNRWIQFEPKEYHTWVKYTYGCFLPMKSYKSFKWARARVDREIVVIKPSDFWR